MNLLCTSVEDFQTLEFQHDIDAWRSARQIVECLPFERVVPYLHFSPSAGLALVDAIVCAADGDLIAFGPDGVPVLTFQLEKAAKLAKDIRNLPECCGMRDGRKWRVIPFIIICNPGHSYFGLVQEMQKDGHTRILTRFHHLRWPTVLLQQIQIVVDAYHGWVLKEYRKVGIIITFEDGKARIGPALRHKHPGLETEYYYPPADRRKNTGWVTVKRDWDGIKHDVEIFQALIDRRVNETEMHKFFEENPAFLMEARLGIPISHQPNFAQPKAWRPDLSLTPILGPENEDDVELIELKGPAKRTLSRKAHPGFSSKVHAAIDQVRDYDRCLHNPINFEAIWSAFGFIPDKSNLAVLIGRTPSRGAAREVFELRRSELNVKVITYDEILRTQTDQIK
jgi:hypothetical protein